MNVFNRELKSTRKSLFFWCLGIIFLIGVGMAKFEALSADVKAMNDMLSSVPKIVKVVFGMGNAEISTAIGFYTILYRYVLIMAGIHAGMLGANIIAKEERDKTAEFLYVKPMSRTQILTQKILALFLNVLLFNLVNFSVSTAAIVYFAKKGEAVIPAMIYFTLGVFLLQLLFASMGVGFAAIRKKSLKSANIVAAILMGTFFISIMSDLLENAKVLEYFTPFKYVDPEKLLSSEGIVPGQLLIALILIVFFITASYRRFPKRDMYV